jgi:hypothetical protein
MAYEWHKYPDKTPTQPGYYYTIYHNPEHDDYLFKSIYWNGKWCSWRPGVMTFPDVKGYVPDTHNPYYVPCTQHAIEHVPGVDLDMFPFLKESGVHK